MYTKQLLCTIHVHVYSVVLESGVLEVREEPALTTSKSPLSAPVSGGGKTKEVDESPLSEARADPMVLAVGSDVSSESGPSHQSTNTNSTNKKPNKTSKHKKHKRHGESDYSGRLRQKQLA